jgi:FtsH-binding integral membrane protein
LATGAIVGHLIALGARPAKACIGLGVSAACFGASSGPFFNQYRAGSITQIALATLTFTVFLGAAGIIYPKSLQSWRGPLCTSVVGLIFLQFAGGSMPALRGTPVHSIREWIAVVTFCAYVVYDFNRAQQIPRTTTNAVQVGAAVFLDVINLFVNLLELMGSKKDED